MKPFLETTLTIEQREGKHGTYDVQVRTLCLFGLTIYRTTKIV